MVLCQSQLILLIKQQQRQSENEEDVAENQVNEHETIQSQENNEDISIEMNDLQDDPNDGEYVDETYNSQAKSVTVRTRTTERLASVPGTQFRWFSQYGQFVPNK